MTIVTTLPPPPRRVRADFREPPEYGAAVASVWGGLEERPDSPPVLTLDHDHPDLRPAAGWRFVCRAGEYEVASADGARLTCLRLGDKP